MKIQLVIAGALALMVIGSPTATAQGKFDRAHTGQELASYATLWERTRAEGGVISGIENARNIEYFLGFVTGVAAATTNVSWCPPRDPPIMVGQAWGIAAKYLREHPENWHLPADHLVQLGLSQAFPCPPKTKKPSR